MKRISCLIIAFIFLAATSCNHCVFAIEDDLGLWTPVYIYLPVNNRFKVNLEVNPRIGDNITHISQLFIRPSIGYQLTKNLSVWQGYARVWDYLPKERENRIWQQILHEKSFANYRLTNRFRVEERFIESINSVPVRLRYMLRMAVPFGVTKRWSVVAFDELFVSPGTPYTDHPSGVDQNRFFIGLNRKISENVNIEGGYQMQYINRKSPAEDKLNHIILINMYINLPQVFQ